MPNPTRPEFDPTHAFLAKTLRETRTKQKRSQEYMALEMGIARKTVQNWEKGISAPSITQTMDWFRILQVSPLPYLFQYVYPEMENISSKDEDEKLRKSLLTLIEQLPPEGIRQLLYLFYGDHGSSPRAVLNMLTAHLQTPMRDRVTASSIILKNYQIAQKQNTITSNEHVQPDLSTLQKAIQKGENAAIEGSETYVNQV